MKICPTCKRSYEDDTLVFCLDDGARLSGRNDLRATVPASFMHDDPARTAILPPDRRPTHEASEPQPTIAAITSGAYRQSTTPTGPTGKGSNSLWIILGGTIALLVVGLIIVVGYLALKANDNRLMTVSSAPSPNVQTNTNVQTNANVQTNGNLKTNGNVQTNSNVQTNGNVETNSNAQTNSDNPANANLATESKPSSDETNLNWLEGVWTGEGYQTDTRTTWTVILTVRDGTFAIEYPNIPCRGTWSLTNKNSRGASFVEFITHGTDRCVNNERVLIERVSDSEISCKFSHAGSRAVIATVVMSKKIQ